MVEVFFSSAIYISYNLALSCRGTAVRNLQAMMGKGNLEQVSEPSINLERYQMSLEFGRYLNRDSKDGAVFEILAYDNIYKLFSSTRKMHLQMPKGS